MVSGTEYRTPVEQLEQGEWLRLLLADVQRDVARHPSADAVERIRGRLLAQLRKPTRAAA